jgi:hypothetical protein
MLALGIRCVLQCAWAVAGRPFTSQCWSGTSTHLRIIAIDPFEVRIAWTTSTAQNAEQSMRWCKQNLKFRTRSVCSIRRANFGVWAESFLNVLYPTLSDRKPGVPHDRPAIRSSSCASSLAVRVPLVSKFWNRSSGNPEGKLVMWRYVAQN